MQFGPLPEKRPVPEFARLQTQEELALKLLRQRQEAEQEQNRAVRAAEKRADRLAEQIALITHKKRFTEGDPLVLSLRQLLKREGIELVTYAGEEVTEELEDQTDIIEWLPAGEDPVSRVVDALEPEIRWQGRILHHAKLSCREGAEEPEADVPEADVPEADVPEEDVPEEDTAQETASPEEAADAAQSAPKDAVTVPRGPKHAHGRKNTRKALKKHKKKANQRKRGK